MASKKKKTPFQIVAKIAAGHQIGSINTTQRKNLKPFVLAVTQLRELAEANKPVHELIDFITEKIDYRAYLQRVYGPESEARWENVRELKVTRFLMLGICCFCCRWAFSRSRDSLVSTETEWWRQQCRWSNWDWWCLWWGDGEHCRYARNPRRIDQI